MAYSTNPNLPKARALAMKLLVAEQLPLQVVANRCGVHRSTVWRWKRKWDVLNANVQLTNDNRPNQSQQRRLPVSSFRLAAVTWMVPTDSARPHSSPLAVADEIVARVLAVRYTLKRCAEVVWHHLTQVGDEQGVVAISLSSVRRILRRHHCFDGARKKRVRPDNPKRPHVTRPGELVETDTIHYVCPVTKRRLYVYTVIDVYSRMAYAEVHPRILPGLAASVVLHARNEFWLRLHHGAGRQWTRV